MSICDVGPKHGIHEMKVKQNITHLVSFLYHPTCWNITKLSINTVLLQTVNLFDVTSKLIVASQTYQISVKIGNQDFASEHFQVNYKIILLTIFTSIRCLSANNDLLYTHKISL